MGGILLIQDAQAPMAEMEKKTTLLQWPYFKDKRKGPPEDGGPVVMWTVRG
jgi:hypothetical protein